MRATMGITWLLLSLSFLFHSICSDESQTDPSVSKNLTAGTAAPDGGDPSGTHSSNAVAASTALAPTADNAGKNSETIQTPTLATPTVVVGTTDISSAAASEPTDKPVPQTQAAITEIPATPPITIPDPTPILKQDLSSADATPSQPQLPSTPTSASKSSSVVSATVQTSEPSRSTSTSSTEVLSNVLDNAGNVKTTMIPNTPTGGAQGQQSPAHTTTASKTSQGDSKGGIQTKTGTVTSPVQTASSTPSPAGIPGTTSTPSIPTNAGPPVAGPSGTKAGTTSLQTIPTPAKATTPTTTTASTTTIATTASPPKMFMYSLNNGHENKEEKELVEVCRRLLVNFQDGSCSLTWRDSNGTKVFGDAEIKGKVKGDLVNQHFEDIIKAKKPTDNKTLIAILASCGALLIMIVILAVCASHHRKPYNENQQHLTDELHTVENGYHDNPTLEVMEAQPEMQEKKMVLNGEFNDSWIVPMDNLLKEDTPEEEDTHL